jgi:phosphate transport system substrate-binding protein
VAHSTFRWIALTMAVPALITGAAFAASARDHISIVGSSTVFPFSSLVAETFGKRGGEKAPVVESTGTGGGFKLFCSGSGIDTPDINDASRPITDAEKATCASNGVKDVLELRVGYDGIILAGPKAQKAFNVTLEQLWRATAKLVPVNGKFVPNPYVKWSDIDPKLPNKKIAVFGPAPNHGTRDAWVELVMDPSCEKAPESKALDKDEKKKTCQSVREDGAWTDVSEDYALILGKLKSNPTAMAVFTFSYLDQNSDKITGSSVEGVPASLETISSGKYPISRPLFIYVKREHLGSVPGLKAFLTEYLSDKSAGAEGYLANKGLIPIPKKELESQRALVRALP